MDILLGFLLIVSVGITLWLFYQLKNFKAKNVENEKEKSYFKDLSEKKDIKIEELAAALNNESVARNLLELQVNLAADEKDKLETKLSSLQEEFTNLQITTSVSAVKSDSAEDLDDQLAQLRQLIEAKNEELVKLTESSNLTTAAINEKLGRLEELDASIRALEGRILSDEKRVEEIKGLLEVLNHDLDDLTNLKASVLKVEEGSGTVWEITPGDDKKRLIELIHELVDMYGNAYPVLRKELLKVEWSTVWLPQLQQLCVREGLDRSGIYKITLKTNDRVVYIGQAQSIKERWYTHFKKMLGVEAKGTERLYEYRPDEMTWEVVEFKEGNLDSDEKYWIDYFKCREIGLNKKR